MNILSPVYKSWTLWFVIFSKSITNSHYQCFLNHILLTIFMHVPALLNLQEKLYINFAQLSRITDRNEYIHLNLLGLTIQYRISTTNIGSIASKGRLRLFKLFFLMRMFSTQPLKICKLIQLSALNKDKNYVHTAFKLSD